MLKMAKSPVNIENYTIKLLKNGKILWEKEFRHPEIVVGMVAAGLSFLDPEYKFETNVNLREYRVKTGIKQEDWSEIARSSLGTHIYDNYKGVWFKYYREYYNLYKFETEYFLQGAIGYLNDSGADFRDYMGTVFDSSGKVLGLNGYLQYSLKLIQTVPNLVDVDRSEQDNENLLNVIEADR